MTRPRRRKPKPPPPSLDNVLQSVREREAPDVGLSENLGIIEVPDPESEDHEVRIKIVNLRDDPVGQMAKRGQLGLGSECYARLKAARKWQTLYEQAEIGGAKGIDMTREYVDGGRFEMPDTDGRMRAADELSRLRQALGMVGERIVSLVLGRKFTIAQVAQYFGHMTRHAVSFYGWQFRQCLDTLAIELGIVVNERRSRGPMRQRDKYNTAARRMA